VVKYLDSTLELNENIIKACAMGVVVLTIKEELDV
jgi:hypothetical protein